MSTRKTYMQIGPDKKHKSESGRLVEKLLFKFGRFGGGSEAELLLELTDLILAVMMSCIWLVGGVAGDTVKIWVKLVVYWLLL